MEIIIRVNLKGTWQMGMENKLHPKDTYMRDTGLMINNKGRALRNSLMVQTLKEDLLMGLKQDLVNSIFQMDPSISSAKTRYKGFIVNNKFNGKGTFYFSDGRKYDGQWKDNLMDGYGTFSWPDGRSYDGYYVKDKKHGFGDFTYSDGSMYKGNWMDGKEHGQGTFYSKNGLYREGEWQNGKRIKWTSPYQTQ